MKVKLIPGPRDEEKIDIIQNAHKSLSEEDFYCFLEQYCSKGCNDQDVWFDALYYASEYGDKALKGQEAYLIRKYSVGNSIVLMDSVFVAYLRDIWYDIVKKTIYTLCGD